MTWQEPSPSTFKGKGGRTIYTIGHSTRPFEDLVALVRDSGVELLCDIRTVPGSHRVPQFNQATLEVELPAHGIAYLHLDELGGFRRARGDSCNAGWRNASFKGYADYMQTPEFAAGLEHLIELARARVACLMCAEAVPWRCHRGLVGDALSVRGWTVLHIMGRGAPRAHELTSFARVDGVSITYPSSEAARWAISTFARTGGADV